MTDNDGAATFSITDLNTENLSFTAEDTTDDVTLTQKATLSFVPPPAASAGLLAFPTTVTADGVTPTDITITLKDSLGRPSPGKLIQITQTGGNSIIGGPNPPVTDSNGMIEFTAVDANNETITYSAVDVTDGNTPFPQTGTVTFSDAPEPGCSNTEIAAPGYVAVPYATGLLSENFSCGGIGYSGCPGPYGMAFDPDGNLFVAELPTGNLYKFPPGGGVASGSTLVGTVGPSLAGLVFDSSGNLFAARNATTGDYTTGAVLQLDPSNASVIQTVATIPCAEPLSIDPLSGDLFTDDSCGGGGANTSLWRIHSPASSPTVSVYATLPSAPNANIGFAPNGTMYVWSNSQAVQVSGYQRPDSPDGNHAAFAQFVLSGIARVRIADQWRRSIPDRQHSRQHQCESQCADYHEYGRSYDFAADRRRDHHRQRRRGQYDHWPRRMYLHVAGRRRRVEDHRYHRRVQIHGHALRPRFR